MKEILWIKYLYTGYNRDWNRYLILKLPLPFLLFLLIWFRNYIGEGEGGVLKLLPRACAVYIV